MKVHPMFRLFFAVLPACIALVACGGGGGGESQAPPLSQATSLSFSPTTARSSSGQNVALRWVYAVNNGQPITANLLDVTMSVTVNQVEVNLDPGNLQRRGVMQGPVTATEGGIAYSGSYSATFTDNLAQAAGRTTTTGGTADIGVTLSGGGETGTARLLATLGSFTPAYVWPLDSETLDQWAVNHVETVTSNGSISFTFTVTDEPPVVMSNLPAAMNDRWTVLEKLPSMMVRGKTYTNVVRLSRLTRVPDFAGNLTQVTMQYWVAKGVGMIRGQGIYRVLNIDDVTFELIETNLGPA